MFLRQILVSLLLTVALVATACSSSDGEVSTVAGADTDDQSSEVDPTDDEDGSDPDDAEETEEPAEAEVAIAEFVSGEVPLEAEKCVARGVLETPGLLSAAMAIGPESEFTDLDQDQQLALLELAVDCAGPELLGEFMAEGFSEGMNTDPPDEMATCFADRIAGSEGSLVLAGLAALGNDTAPEPKMKGPVVDLLDDCVPGSLFADVMVAEFATDPTLVDAVDGACISAAYATESSMRPMWEAMVDSPELDLEDLPPKAFEAVVAPLLGCISFGTVIAAGAVSDGLALSPETIACIDDEIRSSGLLETFLVGDEPDEDALVLATVGCMSSEELQQVSG
ncbi:MAG: hypothetical protein GY713_03090 [Actinomycetia bacterium]|nr:hypothetical protein [Actinomycetes bacterium]